MSNLASTRILSIRILRNDGIAQATYVTGDTAGTLIPVGIDMVDANGNAGKIDN